LKNKEKAKSYAYRQKDRGDGELEQILCRRVDPLFFSWAEADFGSGLSGFFWSSKMNCIPERNK
jgi:hypothetical protein